MGEITRAQVCCGPVIIEDGKVLLNRETKDYGITPWLFPGGRMEDGDESLEAVCKREVKEELGIEIEIIKQLPTLFAKNNGKTYILVHYLAKRTGEIKPGTDIAEWAWHDINNLPENCYPNVKEIIQNYLDTMI